MGILTLSSGEDAMHWTAVLPAQERLLAGDGQQLRLDPRPEVVLPRLPGPASTPRWATQATPCPTAKSAPGAGARRRSSHGGGCRGLGGESRCSCLLPCQCVRAGARVCVRVFASGLFLHFKSFKSKPSRNRGRDFRFQQLLLSFSSTLEIKNLFSFSVYFKI